MDIELNLPSARIIEAAINVHSELGPGLLETVYKTCMLIELRSLDLETKSEVPMPVMYRGEKVADEGFRLDLVVDDKVILELKSGPARRNPPTHRRCSRGALVIARTSHCCLSRFCARWELKPGRSW